MKITNYKKAIAISLTLSLSLIATQTKADKKEEDTKCKTTIKNYYVGGSDGKVYITLKLCNKIIHGHITGPNKTVFYQGKFKLGKTTRLSDIKQENILGWDGTLILLKNEKALIAVE
ncbi:hypothetical protein [Chitinilyticum litopenaei]|uniref:hypothetical protein n=1 Tax=Chitinilyticum litopenaei TaxID=1121276 RepID=UPI001184EDC3|nr:hypothetical protein [Chitinilyticum litopenaei]